MQIDKKNNVYGQLIGYDYKDDVKTPIYEDAEDGSIKIKMYVDNSLDTVHNIKQDNNFWWIFSSISAVIISIFTLTFKGKKNGKRR